MNNLHSNENETNNLNSQKSGITVKHSRMGFMKTIKKFCSTVLFGKTEKIVFLSAIVLALICSFVVANFSSTPTQNSKKELDQVSIQNSNTDAPSVTPIAFATIESFYGTWKGIDDVGDISEISFYNDNTYELSGLGVVAAGDFKTDDDSKKLFLEGGIYTSLSDIGLILESKESTIELYEFDGKDNLILTNDEGNVVELAHQTELSPKTLDYGVADDVPEDTEKWSDISETNETSETSTASGSESNDKLYKYGETFTISNVEFQITNVDTVDYGDYTSVKISLTATNRTGDYTQFDICQFGVIDGNLGWYTQLDGSATAQNNSNCPTPGDSSEPLLDFGPDGDIQNVTLFFKCPSGTDINACTLEYTEVGFPDDTLYKIELK